MSQYEEMVSPDVVVLVLVYKLFNKMNYFQRAYELFLYSGLLGWAYDVFLHFPYRI